MGGCATKLRFWKGDDVAVPKMPEHPRSIEEAKQDVVTESEPDNNIVNPEQVSAENVMSQSRGEPDQTPSNCVYYKVREIIEDDKVDDHGANRRSLSLLFKEDDQDGSLPTEADEKLIVEAPRTTNIKYKILRGKLKTIEPAEQVCAEWKPSVQEL